MSLKKLNIGNMELTRAQLIFAGVAGVLLVIAALVFFGVLPGRKNRVPEITLTLWAVEDDAGDWQNTVSRFRDTYPHVSILFRSFDEDEYEGELVDALAAGAGPDLLFFNNKWALKHGTKIDPFPTQKINAETFGNFFPQVAEQDFVRSGRVFALPLSVDTLALIYNRDIFDRKNVVFPPEHWNDFEAAVPQIREFTDGQMILSAAAIGGTSESVAHSTDILTLLLLQRGVAIVNTDLRRAAFGGELGREVFEFYLQFADPDRPLYTWDDRFGQDFDLFASEKTAMVFAYGSELKDIRAKNPFLDFAVRPVPQLNQSNPVNVAEYWGLAVSDQSQFKNEAWDFAIFAATDRESALEYLGRAGRPPALRFLINDFINDPELDVFASQALTARSWPQPNDILVTQAFDRVLTSVLSGELNMRQAIDEAVNRITQLIRAQ